MKSGNEILVAILLVAWLTAGCAATQRTGFDEGKGAPKKSVDIYDIDQAPSKKHKEIAGFSFRGPREDQSKAFRYFIREAKRLRADGIIMHGPGDGYMKGRGIFGPGGGLIGFGPDFVFTASAIVYDP